MEKDTTHNRMELTAAIEAIKFALDKYGPEPEVIIYSDSQYVIGLQDRLAKLTEAAFQSKAGKPIVNQDLMKKLQGLLGTTTCSFIKVKAHAKNDSISA